MNQSKGNEGRRKGVDCYRSLSLEIGGGWGAFCKDKFYEVGGVRIWFLYITVLRGAGDSGLW